MATVHRNPNSSTASPAPAPVASARARELQERVRVLRDIVAEARHKHAQATDRNRHQLQAELEHAVRACRQAERLMAQLRAEARAAGPAPTVSLDREHPAMELPPEALAQLIAPTRQPLAPVSQVQVPDADFQDLDLNWNRSDTANTALELLQQASERLLDSSPFPPQELLHPEQTATLTDSGIDFGPLVDEDALPQPGGGVNGQTETNPPPAVDTGRARNKPKPVTAPRAAAPRPAASVPVSRPAPTAARLTAPAAAVRSAEPLRPHRPARQTARPRRRSIFRPALFAGLLLGVVTVIALTQLSQKPLWEFSLNKNGASVPDSREPAATSPGTPSRNAWQTRLRQEEQRIRQAAHERFETLRDRLRREMTMAVETAPNNVGTDSAVEPPLPGQSEPPTSPATAGPLEENAQSPAAPDSAVQPLF